MPIIWWWRNRTSLPFLIFLAPAVACSDLPAEPASTALKTVCTAGTIGSNECGAPESSPGLNAALEDLLVRVLPALPSDQLAKALTAAIEDAATVLDAPETDAFKRALANAERALALPAGTSAEAALALDPELDAVRLVLEEARRLLPSSPPGLR